MATRIKTGGRQKGTPNKVTRQFKDAVRIVYDEIGGHEAFAEWARENRGDFYRIAAKLIPAESGIHEPQTPQEIRIIFTGIDVSSGRVFEHEASELIAG